jgi:hypothetical protein
MAERPGAYRTPGAFSYVSEVFSEKNGQTLLGHEGMF